MYHLVPGTDDLRFVHFFLEGCFRLMTTRRLGSGSPAGLTKAAAAAEGWLPLVAKRYLLEMYPFGLWVWVFGI